MRNSASTTQPESRQVVRARTGTLKIGRPRMLPQAGHRPRRADASCVRHGPVVPGPGVKAAPTEHGHGNFLVSTVLYKDVQCFRISTFHVVHSKRRTDLEGELSWQTNLGYEYSPFVYEVNRQTRGKKTAGARSGTSPERMTSAARMRSTPSQIW